VLCNASHFKNHLIQATCGNTFNILNQCSGSDWEEGGCRHDGGCSRSQAGRRAAAGTSFSTHCLVTLGGGGFAGL
jgi:hypothetical protein